MRGGPRARSCSARTSSIAPMSGTTTTPSPSGMSGVDSLRRACSCAQMVCCCSRVSSRVDPLDPGATPVTVFDCAYLNGHLYHRSPAP
ncbi:hypothetical protein BE11_13145 [Sorangium cellulosum]|nr:hypothetical protein BE11_13145 [Sorangium cellulosum]